MNVDWCKVNDSDYHLKPIASKLTDFILEENLTQMNQEYTREEKYNDEVKKSNIDHFYTNTPEKFSKTTAEYLSGSDHKVIKCTKYNKQKEEKTTVRRKEFTRTLI